MRSLIDGDGLRWYRSRRREDSERTRWQHHSLACSEIRSIRTIGQLGQVLRASLRFQRFEVLHIEPGHAEFDVVLQGQVDRLIQREVALRRRGLKRGYVRRFGRGRLSLYRR